MSFGLVAVAVVLTACTPQLTPAQPETATHSEEDWSYHGSNGPDAWGKFGAACQNVETSHGSPINIDTKNTNTDGSAADAAPVTVHYQAAPFVIENNGHTIEAIPEDTAQNSVERDGERFFLQQFHFHAQSEHHINGMPAEAELHLVHLSEGGELLVLGVLLETGRVNPELDELFTNITDEVPEDGGEPLSAPIDPAALLPASPESVQYDGSLTTPPCTEGVQWNVFLSPMTVSAEQLAEYTAVYSDNHRPVQPLHDREVFAVDPR